MHEELRKHSWRGTKGNRYWSPRTRLRFVFSNHFSVFGNRMPEILFLVLCVLLQNLVSVSCSNTWLLVSVSNYREWNDCFNQSRNIARFFLFHFTRTTRTFLAAWPPTQSTFRNSVCYPMIQLLVANNLVTFHIRTLWWGRSKRANL